MYISVAYFTTFFPSLENVTSTTCYVIVLRGERGEVVNTRWSTAKFKLCVWIGKGGEREQLLQGKNDCYKCPKW